MPGAAFFAAVRHSLFGGTVPPSAVDAINALEAGWVASKATSIEQLAYVLATVFNECGAKMLPVEENLSYSAARMLQVWPNKFKSLAAAQPYAGNPQKLGNYVYAGIIGNGNEASGDGYRYRGRGWPQLTGRANYANFSQLIGVDLLGNPDKVMEPETGAKILITGMIDGAFTGKKLADYFTPTKSDAIHARAIVNGDVAANGQKIAGYWSAFHAALIADRAAPAPMPAAPVTAPASVPPAAPPSRTPDPVVKAWQQLLVKAGYPMLPYGADGFGGKTTQDALIAFQKAHKLVVTGQFDAVTRAALNPAAAPHISSLEIAILTAALSNLPFIPQSLKEALMFPTIVQMIIAILPGVPDDIKLVEAEVAELASSDSGIKKLRTALVFGKALIDKIEAIVDKVDPQGAIQPPASQVAINNSAP